MITVDLKNTHSSAQCVLIATEPENRMHTIQWKTFDMNLFLLEQDSKLDELLCSCIGDKFTTVHLQLFLPFLTSLIPLEVTKYLSPEQ